GDAVERYVASLRALAPDGLAGLRLVVDCANGAASAIVPGLLRDLGAEVTALHGDPDGLNINAGCGATHPGVVADAVRATGAHAGLAFDGDADRLIMADERGRVVHGDHILAITAAALHARGRLPGATVVGTVMSNLGLERALARRDLRLARTRVGDRYVLEEMQRLGAVLGGEQSGHVIFLDHATTGDGLVTALLMLGVLRASGEPLSVHADMLEECPQKLVNIPVPRVKGWDTSPRIQQAITAAAADLGADGRVVVRASGTEPTIRVMVEAVRAEQVERWTAYLADIIATELRADHAA
ncbi:MAG TPA: phosphoglucosamine mutase, partial [Armatimonadota bacterium]|nr:phosphoglucosamine mutase [Armatimonadota bacterium]